MSAVWAALWAALACPGAHAQDTVVLRESAEVAPSGPLTLAQIAELSGDGARALAAVEIRLEGRPAGADGWTTVGAPEVIEAIRAVPGVNWGKLTVRGSACAVRRAGDAPARPAAPQRSASVAPGVPGPTLRAAVEQRLREAFGPGGEEVRLTFDEASAALLETPLAGRTADVQLVGSSSRQSVTVRVFEGLRQIAAGTVRVEVRVKRRVALAAQALRRGDPVTPESVRTEERWVEPGVRPADPARVVGRAARGRIDEGSVVEESDIEAAVVIRKGDMVDVYCLSSSINLKSVARATEPGREGETIKLQTPGSKRVFSARVDGPGRAVTGVGVMPGAEGDGRDSAGPEAPGPAERPAPARGAPRGDAGRRVKFAAIADRPVARGGNPPRAGAMENER